MSIDELSELAEIKNTLSESLASYEPFSELLGRVGEASFPIEVEGVQGGFLGYLAWRLHEQISGSTLLVVPTDQEAREVHADLQLFSDQVLSFPWWGTLPYGRGHPLPAVHGLRTYVLSRLQNGERSLIVTSLRGLLNPLPHPREFEGRAVRLSVGDTVDTLGLAQTLTTLGYLRVPRVSLKGEFALRGEVVDVYPYGSEEATRIIFEFDSITRIRSFEPFTQISVAEMNSVRVPPTREVVFDDQALKLLGSNLQTDGFDVHEVQGLLEELRLNPDTPGGEYLFPLCSGSRASLLDYLGDDSLLIAVDSEGLTAGSEVLRREYLELYRKSRSEGKSAGIEKPKANGAQSVAEGVPGSFSPPPRRILLDYSNLESAFSRTVHLHSLKGKKQAGRRIAMGCDPPRSFFGNLSFLKEELQNLIELHYRVFVFAEYAHQAERLRALLKDLELTVLPQGISRGFSLPGLKILVIEENEIFGRKRRIPRSVAQARSRAVESFVDLSPGDFVVHLQYGIGAFNGIERIKAAGHERDYICLEYDGGEKVFLPIEQVNLIQAYIGHEGKRPKLDKLGGKSWQSKKERVRRSVEEMAKRLVSLYSARSTVKGFVFPPDTDWQSEFEARFPYQETEDQLRAIEEVKADMESSRPMDRLICGDVGYGKTEVALRSAFKAVMGGKQVALLAPTTILAEQHYETFGERFDGYPVSIEMLSRFVKPKQQKQVLASLADGGTDIVIGTHRLLQPDVKPKNLGLMIVDEEQRFGVKDKERLKELKTAVDCLTMTATPIPRTLHMALMKIRDMSIINTPPQNR